MLVKTLAIPCQLTRLLSIRASLTGWLSPDNKLMHRPQRALLNSGAWRGLTINLQQKRTFPPIKSNLGWRSACPCQALSLPKTALARQSLQTTNSCMPLSPGRLYQVGGFYFPFVERPASSFGPRVKSHGSKSCTSTIIAFAAPFRPGLRAFTVLDGGLLSETP